ncbi:MAG: hypothetical protein ACOCPQ_02270 [Desulfosudaceae bacterium]
MIRLLLLIGAIYVLYKGRKAWLSFKRTYQAAVHGDEGPARIDDVMVQDPYCRVYFPKKDGIFLKHKGQDLYFCSQECRENYFNQKASDA